MFVKVYMAEDAEGLGHQFKRIEKHVNIKNIPMLYTHMECSHTFKGRQLSRPPHGRKLWDQWSHIYSDSYILLHFFWSELLHAPNRNPSETSIELPQLQTNRSCVSLLQSFRDQYGNTRIHVPNRNPLVCAHTYVYMYACIQIVRTYTCGNMHT